MSAAPAAVLLAALLEVRFPGIDPVALDLPGPLDIRWYGLGYLAGFAVAYLLLRHLARSGFLKMDPQHVADIIFVAVLGVVVGGRVGYVLFYDFASVAANPLRVLRVWEGGLSFHGGLIGVLLGVWWLARRNRVSFLHLTDAMVLAAPFGLFFVRCANFVNGELYGRVASPDVPWAMRFPTDPAARPLLGTDLRLPLRERELIVQRAYDSGLWDRVSPAVPLRHPSQLYEALLEGLLLAAVLWTVHLWARRRGTRPPEGVFGGTFLLCYGLFRVFAEQFRQPDEQFRNAGSDPLGTVLGPLTMGQTLSALMIVGGAAVLAIVLRRGRAARAG